MTTRSPAATIREALLPGDPVSLDEAVELTHASRQATVLALNHLVGRGDLALVRQRLWVRRGASPDPYRLGARIAQPYAFVYGSALALHGAGPAERSEVLVSSPHRFSAFELAGLRYRWARPWVDDGIGRVSVGAEFVRTTNPARTLVDCVRIPANAGGIEELARAVDMMSGLDDEEILRWVDRHHEAALAARLGYLLELSGQRGPEATLARALLERRPSHRVYLAQRRRGGRLVSRWNLIVPAHLASGSV
ncbi:MAG: type IV toxin-antitoxin system AbiEi family antitoxin [Actinomycetes bacterium]